MKLSGIFSERNLLSVGMILLAANLGFLFIRSRAVSTVQGPGVAQCEVDPSDLRNLFKSGKLAARIQWQDTLRVYDADNHPVRFKDLVSEHRKLVFRFSELNCNVCVDSVLNALKSFPHKSVPDNVIVLASYKTYRDLLVFKRINKLSFPVYNVPETVMSASDIDTPFLFVTGAAEKSVFPFIPDREKPDLTARYLEFVRDFLM